MKTSEALRFEISDGHFLMAQRDHLGTDDGSVTAHSISHSQSKTDVIRLFDELHEVLYRYFLCQGLSGDQASDFVQETFLRLHQHIQNGGDRTNLRGWLFQVGRNLARNERKSIRRLKTAALDEEIESQVALKKQEGNPESEFFRKERVQRLQSAIAKLTPQQRECVSLRAAGLKYREIAVLLGIGISTVGDLMQRAVSRLNEDCL